MKLESLFLNQINLICEIWICQFPVDEANGWKVQKDLASEGSITVDEYLPHTIGFIEEEEVALPLQVFVIDSKLVFPLIVFPKE